MYKVLLVEDDPTMVLFYENMKTWNENNFNITAKAFNGQEALEYLEKEKFDLIFTDISMPKMDGSELLRNIRERGYITPIIFASAYKDFEYAQKGIIYDLFDYMVKPVKAERLEKSLKRLKRILDNQHERKLYTIMSELLKEAVVYDENGYDKYGYDEFGFNRAGYNRDGYDREGYNIAGYNKYGYDRQGFDREGNDECGYNREGYNKYGYDRSGYNREGYNKFGFDRHGKYVLKQEAISEVDGEKVIIEVEMPSTA